MPLPIAVTMLNLVVCVPRIGERWGTAPYDMSVADPLEIRSSPTCYPAEFGLSIGQTV